MPVSFAKLIDDPAANWCFRSEPDEGFGGREIPIPRGRLLGGPTDRRLNPEPGMTCTMYALRPESRGSIHIHTCGPREAPATGAIARWNPRRPTVHDRDRGVPRQSRAGALFIPPWRRLREPPSPPSARCAPPRRPPPPPPGRDRAGCRRFPDRPSGSEVVGSRPRVRRQVPGAAFGILVPSSAPGGELEYHRVLATPGTYGWSIRVGRPPRSSIGECQWRGMSNAFH